MGPRKKICIVPYGTKTTKAVVKGLNIIKDAQGALHAVIKKKLRKLKASLSGNHTCVINLITLLVGQLHEILFSEAKKVLLNIKQLTELILSSS